MQRPAGLAIFATISQPGTRLGLQVGRIKTIRAHYAVAHLSKLPVLAVRDGPIGARSTAKLSLAFIDSRSSLAGAVATVVPKCYRNRMRRTLRILRIMLMAYIAYGVIYQFPC